MYSRHNLITVLALLLAFATGPQGLFAQSVDSTLVVGTWGVDVPATIGLMPPEKKAAYNGLPEEVRQQMEGELAARQLAFGEGHAYQLRMGTGDSYSATWALDAATGQLTLDFEGEGAEQEQVLSVDNGSMRLRIETDPASPAIYHELQLYLISRP